VTVDVKIPTVLRKHTDGAATVQADGANLREVIDAVEAKHAGFREQVVGADGALHRFINVYINDEDVRYLDGLATVVADGDVVAILPAVAGGA
jgi:molybdopterin converting factor small subunit